MPACTQACSVFPSLTGQPVLAPAQAAPVQQGVLLACQQQRCQGQQGHEQSSCLHVCSPSRQASPPSPVCALQLHSTGGSDTEILKPRPRQLRRLSLVLNLLHSAPGPDKHQAKAASCKCPLPRSALLRSPRSTCWSAVAAGVRLRATHSNSLQSSCSARSVLRQAQATHCPEAVLLRVSHNSTATASAVATAARKFLSRHRRLWTTTPFVLLVAAERLLAGVWLHRSV